MSELKSCPFCGEVEIIPDGGSDDNYQPTECSLCGATAVHDVAWNTRTDEKSKTFPMRGWGRIDGTWYPHASHWCELPRDPGRIK